MKERGRDGRFHSYQPVSAAEGREECFKSRTVFMQFVRCRHLIFSPVFVLVTSCQVRANQIFLVKRKPLNLIPIVLDKMIIIG